eukprot:COSAG02_NODE_6518_length_3523_cov_8.145444_3_plen_108_part_00
MAREREDVDCKSLDSVHVHNGEMSFSSTLFSPLSEFHPQACIQVGVNETDEVKCVRHHEGRDHQHTQNGKPIRDFQFIQSRHEGEWPDDDPACQHPERALKQQIQQS